MLRPRASPCPPVTGGSEAQQEGQENWGWLGVQCPGLGSALGEGHEAQPWAGIPLLLAVQQHNVPNPEGT